MKRKILFIIILVQVLIAYPQQNNIPINSNLSLFDLPTMSDSNISIGYWALKIANEFDSTVNIEFNQMVLNEMYIEIDKMLSGRTKDMDKFLATKMFLYESGKWNNYKPFSYDFEDPLGDSLENKLLSSYLKSRKGNCVSMPTLFLTLMERVAPETKFVGVKAPNHLFCRFRDKQSGDVYNVETTNGGNPARNQFYIDEMKISEKAFTSGLYLKDLSKKEYIAELISILLQKEKRGGNLVKALEYADLILKLSPNSDVGLINKASLLAQIASESYTRGSFEETELEVYEIEVKILMDKVKELGWVQENENEKDNYLKKVEIEKSKNK